MDHVAFGHDPASTPAARRYREEMANVDLRRLRYFVAVAEERHFGRAAERLHVSPSPLSQRIRELEGELGLTLFHRTSRTVELTDVGERLLAEARAVLAAVDRLEHVATDLTTGALDLGVGYCTGSEAGVMTALRSFRDEHPEVVVHPASMTSLNIIEAITSGRLGLGVVRGSVRQAERVASVPLARVPIDHVAVPAAHPLAERAVVSAADLDGEPVLVVDRTDAPHTYDEILDYAHRCGIRPEWVTHGATQVERVFDMVAIGSGIGWLNSWQAERGPGRDDIVIRPLDDVGIWDEFRVAWRQGDARVATAACVRVVIETCGA
jgi:DNA-binding transcriptional LysR family regulator